MASTWYSQIESFIYTNVKYKLRDATGAPFPKLNCTTKSQNTTPSVFPTLYLHNLTPLEYAQDFENDEVNAVLATIEIQVYSNESENEANKIITSAISAMKDLRWNVTMFPDPQTSDNISFAIARFRKIVTEGDIN